MYTYEDQKYKSGTTHTPGQGSSTPGTSSPSSVSKQGSATGPNYSTLSNTIDQWAQVSDPFAVAMKAGLSTQGLPTHELAVDDWSEVDPTATHEVAVDDWSTVAPSGGQQPAGEQQLVMSNMSTTVPKTEGGIFGFDQFDPTIGKDGKYTDSRGIEWVWSKDRWVLAGGGNPLEPKVPEGPVTPPGEGDHIETHEHYDDNGDGLCDFVSKASGRRCGRPVDDSGEEPPETDPKDKHQFVPVGRTRVCRYCGKMPDDPIHTGAWTWKPEWGNQNDPNAKPPNTRDWVFNKAMGRWEYVGTGTVNPDDPSSSEWNDDWGRVTDPRAKIPEHLKHLWDWDAKQKKWVRNDVNGGRGVTPPDDSTIPQDVYDEWKRLFPDAKDEDIQRFWAKAVEWARKSGWQFLRKYPWLIAAYEAEGKAINPYGDVEVYDGNGDPMHFMEWILRAVDGTEGFENLLSPEQRKQAYEKWADKYRTIMWRWVQDGTIKPEDAWDVQTATVEDYHKYLIAVWEFEQRTGKKYGGRTLNFWDWYGSGQPGGPPTEGHKHVDANKDGWCDECKQYIGTPPTIPPDGGGGGGPPPPPPGGGGGGDELDKLHKAMKESHDWAVQDAARRFRAEAAMRGFQNTGSYGQAFGEFLQAMNLNLAEALAGKTWEAFENQQNRLMSQAIARMQAEAQMSAANAAAGASMYGADRALQGSMFGSQLGFNEAMGRLGHDYYSTDMGFNQFLLALLLGAGGQNNINDIIGALAPFFPVIRET